MSCWAEPAWADDPEGFVPLPGRSGARGWGCLGLQGAQCGFSAPISNQKMFRVGRGARRSQTPPASSTQALG